MITIEDLEKAIQEDARGTTIRLIVKPGSREDAILDVKEDRLRISLKERALQGKANHALIGFLALVLSTTRSSVTLVKGERSRQKTVRLPGEKQKVITLLQSYLNK
ncbi:hypothetical protein GC174_04260 [bacterium]|nr:hypothetical protein [bacterium]